MKIKITEEMKAQALIESQKRNPHIKHHFKVNHMTGKERDQLGFLGEFACCNLFNIDWKSNIRGSYITPDNYDIKHKGLRIDVKSETVPSYYASKIMDRTIVDDKLYGRRLINKGQFNLLSKYDIVLFGIFIRENPNFWHPIGYIETSVIINNYPATLKRPDGKNYPFPGSPVPTSILKPIEDLL